MWFVYKDYRLVENAGKEAYFEATTVPRNSQELYEASKAKAAKKNKDPVMEVAVRRGSPVLRPREPFEPLDPYGKSYSPLVATPFLFLEFARIVERKNPEQAIRDWICQYGLLGLQRREPRKFDMTMGGGPIGSSFATEYSQRGGDQESLLRLLSEARQANRILTFYEAILSRDVEKLEQIAFENESVEEFLLNEHLPLEVEIMGADYADVLIDWVLLTHILEDVQEILKEYAFPCIAHRRSVEQDQVHADWDPQRQKHVVRRLDPKSDLWAPDNLVRSLYPRNLLGAMYLQFYWLVTSAAELKRCLECGRIIPLSSPMPESGRVRKTYRNKKFCDERCRQRYHYHNEVKPKRNGSRNGGNA